MDWFSWDREDKETDESWTERIKIYFLLVSGLIFWQSAFTCA